MKCVTALLGKPNAGKETAGKLLAEVAKEHGASAVHHRFRDPLEDINKVIIREWLNKHAQGHAGAIMEIVCIAGQEPTRENHAAVEQTFFEPPTFEFLGSGDDRPRLQKIAQLLKQDDVFGPRAVGAAVHARFKNSDADIVIADGMRWPGDAELIRDFGKKGVILYLPAPAAIRFARALRRARDVGEASLTWEKFIAEDNAENEIYIERIARDAANNVYEIDNSVGVTDEELKALAPEFKSKIHAFFHIKVQPLLFG